MALALYRKYRPRTFAEVIGQEHVTEPLSQALRSGRLHHAYLFSGPRGCGKTSSARILARSLNCEQGPTPDPCGVCASCKSLANDGAGSIDVIEIDAASHGGVDDARDLREKAFFAPASSRYKIYVIDEAHMVSSAGFNALLKLVEEPPDYVKFIFATTEPEKVLGTIRSRTHHYPFRLIPPAVLRPYLQQLTEAEGVHVEPAVFPLVVRAGGGSARDSLSVLDQLIAGAGPEGVSYTRAVSLLGVTDVALIDEMCDALAAGDGATAYSTIDRVAEAGHDARRFASDLLERFRDLIVLQQVPDAVSKGLIDGPTDQLDAMTAQATRLGPATLSRCADIVHNGLVEMRGTTAPRLLLELITARMLLPGADDTTGALLQRLERMERRLTLTADHPQDSVRAQQPTPTPTDQGAAPPAAEVAAARAAARGGRAACRGCCRRRAPPADPRRGSLVPRLARPRRRASRLRHAHVSTGAGRTAASSDAARRSFAPEALGRGRPQPSPDGRAPSRRSELTDCRAGAVGVLTGARPAPPEPAARPGRDHGGRSGPRRPAMPVSPGSSPPRRSVRSGPRSSRRSGGRARRSPRSPPGRRCGSWRADRRADVPVPGAREDGQRPAAAHRGRPLRGAGRPLADPLRGGGRGRRHADGCAAAPGARSGRSGSGRSGSGRSGSGRPARGRSGSGRSGSGRSGSGRSGSGRSGRRSPPLGRRRLRPRPAQAAPPQAAPTQAAPALAAPARQREAAAPAATTSDDGDDWPEPARPGGSAAAPAATQAATDLGRGACE